jgi:hypothetical protein
VTYRTTIPAEAFRRTTLAAAITLTTLFLGPVLRAVNSTSAANDKSFLRAVDATACRRQTAKLASVKRVLQSVTSWLDK